MVRDKVEYQSVDSRARRTGLEICIYGGECTFARGACVYPRTSGVKQCNFLLWAYTEHKTSQTVQKVSLNWHQRCNSHSIQ